MKTSSKALLTLACALLLVVASVMGTLAYLTDTDTVNNTFTVGKVDIKLDEAKVNGDGKPVKGNEEVTDPKNADRVNGNSYHLLPGHSYTKDPTIHVKANSEACYLFVTLKNDIKSLILSQRKDEEKGLEEVKNIEEQMVANGWTKLENDTFGENDNTELWYYGSNGALTKVSSSATQQDEVLFTGFTINGNVKNGWESRKIGTDGSISDVITVKAYAIQADGFGTDPTTVWNEAKSATGYEYTEPTTAPVTEGE